MDSHKKIFTYWRNCGGGNSGGNSCNCGDDAS